MVVAVWSSVRSRHGSTAAAVRMVSSSEHTAALAQSTAPNAYSRMQGTTRLHLGEARSPNAHMFHRTLYLHIADAFDSKDHAGEKRDSGIRVRTQFVKIGSSVWRNFCMQVYGR